MGPAHSLRAWGAQACSWAVGTGFAFPAGKTATSGPTSQLSSSAERIGISVPCRARHAGHEWQRGTFLSGTVDAAHGRVAPPPAMGVEKRDRVTHTALIVKVLPQT